MQDQTLNEEYTVVAKGVEVRCKGIEQVVTAVKALSDREVPLPLESFARMEAEQRAERNIAPSPLAQTIAEIMAAAPRPLRPVEVMYAVRKRGLRSANYNNVYAALRYGPFEKAGGRWTSAA